MNFIEACLAGTAHPGDVDDWIDRWHEDSTIDPAIGLCAYLGFTEEEGRNMATDPDWLDVILSARREA